MGKEARALVAVVLSFFLVLVTVSLALAEMKSLVRVYVTTPEQLKKLPRVLDVASRSFGRWIDVVVTPEELSEIQATGLPMEVIHEDLEAYANSVKGSYRTFPQLVSNLETIATTFPHICQLDTVGITYEGRPLLLMKISDNVSLDEPGETELFFMGLHHAREWPSLEIAYYIAETLVFGHGHDSHLTDIVNTREIWVMPCVNPDGYVYCHDQGHDWRQNRRYFPQYGTYGVDLNRNYDGSCNGAPEGAWGTTPQGVTSHGPSWGCYCGPYPFSEAETQAVKDLFLAHDFIIDVSYHTYGEQVIWPWGYSAAVVTPDDDLMVDVGTEMASRITRQSGSGTYEPVQFPGIGYVATGTQDDWAYGYHHYVTGENCLSYTVEACEVHQPAESYLDQIVRENFDGALYLCDIADSVAALMIPRAMSPVIDSMGTIPDGNYIVSWNSPNPVAGVDLYWLDELTGLSVITDDAEEGDSLWETNGFSLTTERSHSLHHSFRSSSGVNEACDAMTTLEPYLVSSGDSLTFWCWYHLEDGWDMGYAEVSADGRHFMLLDTTALFTGASGDWVRHAYSLEDYAGQSVYFRFRHTTDQRILEEGFYVDDIHPAASYASTMILSSNIADTFYAVVGRSPGDYFYRVKGHNAEWGWGDWSFCEDVLVPAGPIPPEWISDLRATLSGNIYLNWSPVTVDTAGNPVTIDHYVIHRDTISDFLSSSANSLDVSLDTAYEDTTAGTGNPSVSHFYLVRAVDGNGTKSEESNRVGEFDRALVNEK